MKLYTQKDLTKIAQAILRKEDPLYLSYDSAKKEQFRNSLNLSEDFDLTSKIERYLGPDQDTDQYLYYYNSISTRVYGLGSRFVTFNEGWGDLNLTEIDTIGDLSEVLFEFYQEVLKGEGVDPQPEYSLIGLNYWSRMILAGRLWYVEISSLESDLYHHIEQELSDRLTKLIPYDFVEGPDHGKPVEGFSNYAKYNLEVSADGLEEVVDKLLVFIWEIAPAVAKRYQDLAEERPAQVYFRITNNDPYDPSGVMVVNNSAAADKIRLSHIHEDSNKLLVSDHTYSEIKDKALGESIDLFMGEYQRLMEEHKPEPKAPVNNVINLFGDKGK